MNWADWLIIVVIVISALISLKRGFVKEALSLVTWILAFVIARTFSFNFSTLLVDYIDTYSVRVAAAFFLLFVLTLIVGSLINYLITSLIKMTGLTGTDRLLGMVFGMARGALLVVVAVALLKLTPMAQDVWWRESYLIPHFLLLEEWSFSLFRELAEVLLSSPAQ